MLCNKLTCFQLGMECGMGMGKMAAPENICQILFLLFHAYCFTAELLWGTSCMALVAGV